MYLQRLHVHYIMCWLSVRCQLLQMHASFGDLLVHYCQVMWFCSANICVCRSNRVWVSFLQCQICTRYQSRHLPLSCILLQSHENCNESYHLGLWLQKCYASCWMQNPVVTKRTAPCEYCRQFSLAFSPSRWLSGKMIMLTPLHSLIKVLSNSCAFWFIFYSLAQLRLWCIDNIACKTPKKEHYHVFRKIN